MQHLKHIIILIVLSSLCTYAQAQPKPGDNVQKKDKSQQASSAYLLYLQAAKLLVAI